MSFKIVDVYCPECDFSYDVPQEVGQGVPACPKCGEVATKLVEAYKAFITVTGPALSGFFATMYWWNSDDGGFYEPFMTGIGRHSKREDAVAEAKQWAEDEGMEFRDEKSEIVVPEALNHPFIKAIHWHPDPMNRGAQYDLPEAN